MSTIESVRSHAHWVETPKDAFFARMGPMNVTPYPKGNWPYTSEWKLPCGRLVGLSVGHIPDGKALPVDAYFLPA